MIREFDSPPLILSLSTATAISSVALHEGDRLISTIEYHVGRSHSDTLQDMVTTLLKIAQRTISDLATIAINIGPGSYTGLRIGTAFAKGICYGSDISLIAINTLQSLIASYQAPRTPGKVLHYGLLDARGGRAFGMVMEGSTIHKDTHVTNLMQNPLGAWKDYDTIYCMGSGADVHADLLSALPKAKVIPGVYPKASTLGRLAYPELLAGNTVAPTLLTPLYISAFGTH